MFMFFGVQYSLLFISRMYVGSLHALVCMYLHLVSPYCLPEKAKNRDGFILEGRGPLRKGIKKKKSIGPDPTVGLRSTAVSFFVPGEVRQESRVGGSLSPLPCARGRCGLCTRPSCQPTSVSSLGTVA